MISIRELQNSIVATQSIVKGSELPWEMTEEIWHRIATSEAQGLERGWNNAMRLVLSHIREVLSKVEKQDMNVQYWLNELDRQVRELK